MKNYKHAVTFGFISVFLTGIGLTIVSPVLPFIAEEFTTNAKQQDTIITLLMSVYALSVFIAAPILGSLSDSFGRKPVLIISLIGSAIGYLIFGLGGSIFMLFVGRIIEGITGGEISAIYAYFSDITTSENRTKYFGWLSAIVGVGTAMGPLVGGVLATYGNEIPFIVAAAITIINAIYGLCYMPESLPKEKREKRFVFTQMNPIKQLSFVFSITNVKWILLAGLLLWLPNGSFQSIFSQYSIDTFAWNSAIVGITFSMIGVLDILSQLFLMPQLLKRYSDRQISLLGMTFEFIGYIGILLSSIVVNAPFFFVGLFCYGVGDAIFSPSYNGMLSKQVEENEQGRLQGGAQSIQSLARVIGPIIGGQLYSQTSHASVFVFGIVFVAFASITLRKVKI